MVVPTYQRCCYRNTFILLIKTTTKATLGIDFLCTAQETSFVGLL